MVPSTSLQSLKDAGLVHSIVGDPSVRFVDVQHDSRRVLKNHLFVALKGQMQDGSRFVQDAITRGAAAVLADHAFECHVPLAVAHDARIALGKVAEKHFAHPSSSLSVAGITGTNGKTTLSYLLEAAVFANAALPAVMGTIEYRGVGLRYDANHTTPEADDISRFARAVLDRGATHLLLEVSSHALALHRVDALDFKVAAFLNLSQDHLDFHKSLEEYFQSKARLFLDLRPEYGAINIDDEYGKRIADLYPGKLIRCSFRNEDTEFFCRRLTCSSSGVSMEIRTPKGELAIHSRLIGEHNAYNLLLSLACCHALGLDLEKSVQGIEQLEIVPGRLQPVKTKKQILTFVDYAHTPDALSSALRALRKVAKARILLVFGCGGDRDQDKRSLMGEVAAKYADLIVLSNDNPRSEDPDRIIEQIETGLRRAGELEKVQASQLKSSARAYACIPDRREAVAVALEAASSGDVLLVAGKGHEDYQIIGQQRRHFSDFEAIKEADSALVEEDA
ncbi:MAG: UDP-N-acetylmuramoyl-L-alanyl-D-glutamate--2,6-diaminopimelate ligase [Myxococcales bacterium]|nr:MAG: UDP-N-acetylmuramoyl-L-alanyl-D-glutamate--2,6-diaminopimelate ligase [Myxococcales bacterium]